MNKKDSSAGQSQHSDKLVPGDAICEDVLNAKPTPQDMNTRCITLHDIKSMIDYTGAKFDKHVHLSIGQSEILYKLL